jgi:hypothetical protein
MLHSSKVPSIVLFLHIKMRKKRTQLGRRVQLAADRVSASIAREMSDPGQKQQKSAWSATGFTQLRHTL